MLCEYRMMLLAIILPVDSHLIAFSSCLTSFSVKFRLWYFSELSETSGGAHTSSLLYKRTEDHF